MILEIRDGQPDTWWLSPDIWTVPGDDPQGKENPPVAGKNCFIWARVTNHQNIPVHNARVNFYWANPSLGFDRDTANFIGYSYVSFSGRETKEVLCLTPWVPEFLNRGHECLLVEAFHETDDPLPATRDFNVPTDPHVAQRNLSVMKASEAVDYHILNGIGHFTFKFDVVNQKPIEDKFDITIQEGKVEDIQPLLKPFKINPTLLKTPLRIKTLKLSDYFRKFQGDRTLKTVVPPLSKLQHNLQIELSGEGSKLLHVRKVSNGVVVGGLSFLVIA